MNWYQLIVCSPIDKKARIVTSQKGCVDLQDLSLDEMIELSNRMGRKMKLLKVILDIQTDSKRNNFIKKMRNGLFNQRCHNNGRAAHEYMRIGKQISIFCAEIARRKAIVKAMRKQQLERMEARYATR